MSLKDAFDSFSPLTSEIPPLAPQSFYLELISIRARQLLNSRTEKQIVSALDVVSWMLDEGRVVQSKQAVEQLSAAGKQDSYVHTDAKALRLFMPLFDIKKQQAFPDATWAEYFAILALAQVAEITSLTTAKAMRELPVTDSNKLIVEELVKSMRLDEILEATETISAAEFLAEEKSYMARAGRRGGKRHVAKYDQLKEHVFQAWQTNHQHRSNRDAAKRIWRETPDNLKSALRTDDPEKRLEIWTGKKKKGLI